MKSSCARNASISLMSLLLLICGLTVQAGELIPLRAGPLTMAFDQENAFLRYVKVGTHEVLRGINAPIRDQYWGTVLPRVTNFQLNDGGDHFSLSFDAICREREIDFRWHGTITGSAQGEVKLTFDGVAHSDFQRNRIGYCVLHGPTAAGQPWVIENIRGESSKGQFPTYISPHQPAKAIQAISHQVADGIWAHLRFSGDVFEMEDQRNWTDASFKTYCTPLERPYPVPVAAGTKISQSIQFRVDGTIPADVGHSENVILTVGPKLSDMPPLGLQVSSELDELSPTQVQRLKELRLEHLQVNLRPTEDAFRDELRRAASQARALGVSLHVALQLGLQPEPELKRLVDELKAQQPPVSVWLLINADEPTFQLARKYLQPVVGEALMGVGKDTNFVDLNRDRPTDHDVAAISYAMNPQIHAVDDASMIETLSIQGDTVRSARQFAGGRRVLVCPITLRPQQVSQEPLPGELPADVDIRQTSWFAAGWTVGSVKFLAEAGVDSATYYETVGWKGVIDADQPPTRPASFPSSPGHVFPIYSVLRDIGDFVGGQVQQIDSSDNLAVVALMLRKSDRTRLLIANLTGSPRRVALRGLGEAAEYELLDTDSLSLAGSDNQATGERRPSTAQSELSLLLPPYAVARMDRHGDE